RDGGPEPGDGKRKAFSLGRSQMAFWFFLVLASYLLISIITREILPIPGGVLGLMGIATITALGGAMVDVDRRVRAQQELPKVQKALPQATTPDETAALDANKREAAARLQPSASEGFLKDIVSDADGPSLHRFQILVWTLILGGVFLIS